MTTFATVDTLDVRSDEAGIRRAAEDAHRAHASGVRLDGRRSATPGIAGQRAMIRHFVDGIIEGAKEHMGTRLDAAQANTARLDLELAIADGLGLQVHGDEVRMDAASLMPRDLFSATEPVIFGDEPETAFTDLVPKRNIDTWAEYVPTRTGALTGSFAPFRNGQKSAPIVGAEYSEQVRTVVSMVAKTQTSFVELAQAPLTSVNKVADDARAAREVWMKLREAALIEGIPNTSWKGLEEIPAPVYASTVNYSTASLADIYADLINMVQDLRAAADDTKAPQTGMVLGMAQAWVDAIVQKSNISAGGSMTGPDVLGMLVADNAGLSMALRQAGISRIVAAPSLDDMGPGATYAGAVLFRPGDRASLREIVAMELSPVRTASSLYGNEQLWCFRGAGLEWSKTQKQGIAYARVA